MSSIMLQCLKMVLMKNFQESQTRAQMTQFDKGQSYLVKSITRQVIQVSTDETLLISALQNDVFITIGDRQWESLHSRKQISN